MLLRVLPAAANDGIPDTKLTCIQEHSQAQRAMNTLRLLEARVRLDACASDSCPPAIRKECVAWLDEVKRGIPSLTMLVRDSDGRPARGARLFIDGNALSEGQNESPVPLDPGTHTVRIEHDGHLPIERSVQLDRGSGERIIAVDLALPASPAPPTVVAQLPAPAPAAPAAEAPRPAQHASGPVDTRLSSSAAPYAYGLLALGGVALGSFAWFGVSGRSRQTDLETNCAPYCAHAEVDLMRRDYLIADISLGVGLASLGGAAFLFATQREVSEPDVGLRLGPGSVAWSGRF